MNYADIIAFNTGIKFTQNALTYEIPEGVLVQPGEIVEVPFGKKTSAGVVWETHNRKPSFATKPILQKYPHLPHLAAWQIELSKWMSEYYLCPAQKIIKQFIPQSLFQKERKTKTKEKTPPTFTSPIRKPLTKTQHEILDQFLQSTKTVSLLHGVTGSGKTEIYLNAALQIKEKGHQILILIPEISLTPQTVHRFQEFFGEPIAIINSHLTPKQRRETWLAIYQKKINIIVGSRSALFAPFQNLGLIVLDEEHDSSYKQDQTPRYHAITVGEKMAELLGSKVLMGSATPTLESYYAARQDKYQLLELKERVSLQTTNLGLPHTTIVDLKEELKKRNLSIFSDLLYDKMKEKLEKKEQIILFLNRRGAASGVICRQCGYVCKCPNCSIAMTYHTKLNTESSIFKAERLICHHCSRVEAIPYECPLCSSPYIRYIGLGTQRLETELQKAFPLARIARADRDTITQKDEFKDLYNAFKEKKIDILIGTQMIAMGLDFPSVNLVGIVLADLGLTIPSFRSSERVFQTVMQVAGRSGRQDHGEVIIQTYLPDNYAIKFAAEHDYLNFYETELKIRETLNYPPFSKLIKITVSNPKENLCLKQTQEIVENLKQHAPEGTQINSYPALIPRFKNLFRFIILISGADPASIVKAIKLKDNMTIDVDPLSPV